MSLFSTIKIPKPRRSVFDLSHTVKTTTEFGRLTPIMCEEVLPGDTFRLNSKVFARLAPMVFPVMANVQVYTHFFFVPNRLLWDKWEEFISGGEDGTSMPEPPRIRISDLYDAGYFKPGSLADYLGLPVTAKRLNETPGDEVSALPFKACAKIWNDYYRDENLQAEIDIHTEQSGFINDTDTVASLGALRYRAWRKDYFTSALPWPQRGVEMRLPLKGDEVSIPGTNVLSHTNGIGAQYRRLGSTGSWSSLTVAANNIHYEKDPEGGVSKLVGEIPDPNGGDNIAVELNINSFGLTDSSTGAANIQGPTVNELRRSIAIQEWFEASARAGARYIEQLYAHFGVRSSDARLQRAEYLGGGRSPVIISEVLQQSQTTQGATGSALGTMAGHGVTAQATHGFKKYFEEHGFLIGFMSILPDAQYMQGISRMWTRMDKFDYAWPKLANIGEQEILRREVYYEGEDNEGNQSVFGYAPRYAEYKYKPSTIHGDFRDTLKDWHLARIFENAPALNGDFITCDQLDSLNRVWAVDDGIHDHFWINISHQLRVKRALPYYGTPAI